ncbi:MAG: NAD-dependent epimerase/dehydratase family protein [Bdellovibrionota bacterium]
MKILVIGGNRFFGKRLVQNLLKQGHDITLLNRGHTDDGFGQQIRRLQCDRTEKAQLEKITHNLHWDIVYDQVCYDYRTAKDACEVFNEKTNSYIFTSSQSVYNAGKNLKETDFNPKDHNFEREEIQHNDYAEAKRQAEVGFYKYSKFDVTYARFPIVVGLDDYTQRFKFHVDRIKMEKPIYFPNIEAQISFVTSEFAAHILSSMSVKPIKGAINIASPKPISLLDFIKTIEKFVDKKMISTPDATEENQSPYGIHEDWFMNCDRLNEFGENASEIIKWLPELLKQYLN